MRTYKYIIIYTTGCIDKQTAGSMRNAVSLSLANRISQGLNTEISQIQNEKGHKYSVGTFQFERIL